MGDPKIRSSSPSSVPYARLRGSEDEHESSRSKKWLVALSFAAVGLLAIAGVFGCCFRHAHEASGPAVAPETWAHWQPVSRGPAQGVSEKTSGTSQLLRGADRDHPLRYSWTNTMLQFQRTAFHFQPEKNWMNDPNGPVYYKGWYHFFYQYNPNNSVWECDRIVWGHSVSRDLVNWLHLPLAMVNDRWYDAGGVWTGSATVLHDGRLVMLYTGLTNASVQVQCLSVPADTSDPLLLHWIKSDANPVLLPPPGVNPSDFRDPTTALWDREDAAWRIVIGSKNQNNNTGISLVYRTTDFVSYELLPGVLYSVQGTGMWECVDFYPVATAAGANALNTSADAGEGVKHVLKASRDEDRNDYYALGSYNAREVTWTPDDPEADVCFGLRYDYGKFYASKTFYDHRKARRVLWGWIGEADSERIDILKGWASVQSIPRTVLYDNKTGTNLILWPVEELESLRTSTDTFNGIDVAPGSVHPLGVSSATELDIEAEFEIKASALGEVTEADAGYNCRTSGGAANRGALGPFGFLVLADGKLREQTAVYFYVSRSKDGGLRTHFCHDESRSSKANDVIMTVVGSTVPVLEGEKLSVRILVDHSIVESFAQGGRTCITSRVYPTEAIYGAARVFLFNNATSAQVTATSIKIWQMSAASFHRYSPPQG